MTSEILVGAVAYTANVVPIWEGIHAYFRDSSAPMDFVLYSNYERQVECLQRGDIDIAWNTNVAWLRTLEATNGEARALAMRDTDLTFQTVFVARTGAGLVGLADLAKKRVVLGSKDSAQARILPIHFLVEAGIEQTDYDLTVIDSDVGKHGDTGRSELDALRVVLDDEADATAIAIATWRRLAAEGAVDDLEVFWTSPEYCHCNFTALPSLAPDHAEPWVRHLLAMDWGNPEHRRILELEGLTRWVRPQLDGYVSLTEAMRAQQLLAGW